MTDNNDENVVDVIKQLFSNRSFVLLVLAACAINTTAMGSALWTPTFMRRVYEFNAAEAGTWYFALNILPNAIGALGGAYLADRLAQRDFRWYGWLPALCSLIAVPLGLAFYLIPTEWILFGFLPTAFAFSIGQSLLAATWAPVAMSLGQYLAPESNRAVAAATWSMTSSFIGMGLGPLLVGDMTTRLEPEFGTEAVRYSLALMTGTGLLAAFFFYRLAGSLKDH